MQGVAEKILERYRALLQEGAVDRLLGWKKGEFFYDPTPAVFVGEEGLSDFVYGEFCGSNLSKYLIDESKKEGRVLVCLKPCDTYSFNQLLLEHRIQRDKVFVLGVPCGGMLDMGKLRAQGITGALDAHVEGDTVRVSTLSGGEKSCKAGNALLLKCMTCKGKDFKAADEVLEAEVADNSMAGNRFAMVERLENMTAGERFNFWRGELSRCIRCNACRNVCPACSCRKCVFDNDASGVASKANADSFEENMFHIIRAFHVAGRCTDCGECSRVCPQHIPLHLLNRKFIKDIDELYGEYQAGESPDSRPPLANFTKEDAEPSIVRERGRA